MNFSVDRDLPVPIRQQLRGLIEYGVACGELRAGEALPSVRDLAERIGVAPMTVSQVYRELKANGLIEARTGSGTFIADSEQARTASRPEALQLRRSIDALIDEGLAMGVGPGDLASLVNARLVHRASLEQVPNRDSSGSGRRARVAMIGLFAEATASYAEAISARLGEAAAVEPTTLTAMEASEAAFLRAASADLAITFVNRQREVAALLANARVVAIRFIPSQETRQALASLDPLARLGVVSRFADFLPILKAGVQRFAPHVADIEAATIDTPRADTVAGRSTVVVYATGAEAILSRIAAGTPAVEYRHIPDPADIDRVILPAVREILRGRHDGADRADTPDGPVKMAGRLAASGTAGPRPAELQRRKA